MFPWWIAAIVSAWKSIQCLQKDLNFISWTDVKTRHGGFCVSSQHWGGRQIPGAHGAATLVLLASSRLKRRLVLKNGRHHLKNSTWDRPSTSTYMHTHVQQHIHKYMQTHTHAQKCFLIWETSISLVSSEPKDCFSIEERLTMVIFFPIRSSIMFVGAEEVILSNERFLPSPEKRNSSLSFWCKNSEFVSFFVLCICQHLQETTTFHY